MTTIQVRIDKKEKQAAKKIFDSLGMDMSFAIKLFLKQTTIRKGLPFLLLANNTLTLEQEEEILNIATEARSNKNLSKPMSGKQLIDYLKTL